MEYVDVMFQQASISSNNSSASTVAQLDESSARCDGGDDSGLWYDGESLRGGVV